MDWTLLHDNFEKYNKIKTTLSKVNTSTWHNTPAVVLMNVYERDESSSLCEEPIITCFNLAKLSNLNNHFENSDGARQLLAIVLMEHFDDKLPIASSLTFDKFIQTYTTWYSFDKS